MLVSYNAKVHPHLPKLRALLAGLAEKSGQHPEVIIVRHPFGVTERSLWDAAWKDWDDVVAEGREKKLGRTPDGEIEWKRLDFNWPLWILFSSGTTGAWRALCLGSHTPSWIPNYQTSVCRPSKVSSVAHPNGTTAHSNVVLSCRPIVHRAGGMLIQSKKEFVICADLQPHDVFFYYTTTLAIPSLLN